MCLVSIYYAAAAVITGRIAGLVRPSVCLSVPYDLLTGKQKSVGKKNKNGVTGVQIFSSKDQRSGSVLRGAVGEYVYLNGWPHIALFACFTAVLASVCTHGDGDQQSGYCSFPRYLQDVDRTAADPGGPGQRKTTSWISRTLYSGVTDSWTRRTVVTINGGLMRIEHLLHASCRYKPILHREPVSMSHRHVPSNVCLSISLPNIDIFFRFFY